MQKVTANEHTRLLQQRLAKEYDTNDKMSWSNVLNTIYTGHHPPEPLTLNDQVNIESSIHKEILEWLTIVFEATLTDGKHLPPMVDNINQLPSSDNASKSMSQIAHEETERLTQAFKEGKLSQGETYDMLSSNIEQLRELSSPESYNEKHFLTSQTMRISNNFYLANTHNLICSFYPANRNCEVYTNNDQVKDFVTFLNKQINSKSDDDQLKQFYRVHFRSFSEFTPSFHERLRILGQSNHLGASEEEGSLAANRRPKP